MGEYVLALVIGFALDALLGDPAWLLHPVCIIGSYISFAEKRLRARGGNLRKSALLLTVSTVLLTMAASGALLALLSCFGRIPRLAGMALLDWLGLAMTSLAREARGVERALDRGVEAGRAQVARIVGRDTQRLSEEEIIKATVETVAENTTDGVIAPMLYAALGGPVLLWGFKAASTLDSMVGYMDERYRDIGWSSARPGGGAHRTGREKRLARDAARLCVSQEPQLRMERGCGGGRAAHPARRHARLLRQADGKADDWRRGPPGRAIGHCARCVPDDGGEHAWDGGNLRRRADAVKEE